MPTLPLYTPADVPDASHRVVAPGGYETWHFDAESAAGEVRLVAVLGVGPPLHAPYLSRYLQYRRRPRRRPPPVPGDYPFAHFAVYEDDRALAQFSTHAAPEDFAASPHEPAVKVAGNEFVRDPDGSFSLRFRGVPSGTGTRRTGASCLSAQLTFRPLLPHPPYETALTGHSISPDLHQWVIAAPSCEVWGSVAITPEGSDGSRAGVREMDFRGRGYHDHRYGTGPLGATLRRWASGRVFLGGTTYAFHVARPLDRRLGDDVRLVRCDADGVEVVEKEPLRVAWGVGRGLQPPYPAELACDSRLRLVRPRVVDASASRVRLLYHASAHGGGETGTAWCEVEQPPRRASAWRDWVANVT
jgi:carotenoid 1,2-hydratase